MANVQFPNLFFINKETLSFEQVARKDLVKGETYLMMFEVLDDDDFEIIPDNYQTACQLDNQIWIAKRTIIVVKYIGHGLDSYAFETGKQKHRIYIK